MDDTKAKTTAQPPKKRSRFRWLLYLACWLTLLGVFGALAMTQASEYSELRTELARIEADTERALYNYEALRRQIAFIGSDAYIEQRARELGLVLPNQLRIVNITR